MPARVILRVDRGPLAGKVFIFLEHDTWVFGRDPGCHAAVPNDRLVSRRHFLLEANPPEARIRDLGSLNGTYVNGVKVGGREADDAPRNEGRGSRRETALQDGDRIAAGKTTIAVVIERPATCSECGAEMPHAEPAQSDSARCDACGGRPVAEGATAPLGCQRCGADVAAQEGAGWSGEYLCGNCRSEVVAQPGGLRQLLQQAARSAARRETPQIAGYELGAALGRGGMGVVYRATPKDGGPPVAVKVMLATVAVREDLRKRFLREIDVARRLRHPHVVRVLTHGSAGSAFYFVMEYCNAGSLATLKADPRGAVPLRVAGPMMLQCLSGLQYAHARELVHRDIKPQNILLHRQNDGLVAKITDFGLAKNFLKAGLSGMTATGLAAGTYHWMPREQLTDFKYAKPANDVWSAAATFYYLLTGRHPRDCPPDRDPIEVVLQENAVEIRKRDPKIPAPLAEVLDRALSADPEQRYQDAAEMRAALASALGE